MAGAEASPELVAAVDGLVDELLLPRAEEIDRSERVPLGHYDALADIGLYGMTAPVDVGGLALSPVAIRHVIRRLGSGCGATAFSFAQHLGTTAAVAATDNPALRDRWLADLATDTLSGTAYAHLRRSGPPTLRAEPSDDGWRFSGAAPWVTSWGTAEVISMAARSDDDRIVWALIDAREQEGMRVDRRFDLMVFQATATVSLAIDDLAVPAERVLSVHDAETWVARDRPVAARANPACIGVGDRAIALISAADEAEGALLQDWWHDLAARAEAASAEVDRGGADPATVAAVRAEVLAGVQRLTMVLLAVAGGGAIVAGHPAQRLIREASFYVIQAQSVDGRRAMLDRLEPGRKAQNGA